MKSLMERLKDKKRIRGFIVSYYIIGFAGMVFPLTKPFFEQLTGLTILISFALMMLYHEGWTMRFIVASSLIYIAGFAVEAAGVQTGEVFGHYAYHTSLGPRIMGTPLLIGINWLMLIYAVYHIVNPIRIHTFAKPFIGALLMVLYDYLLEPVAIHWNMWKWGGTVVPVRNYFAWFLISLLFLALMQVLKIKYRNGISTLIIIAQCCFFLLLNLYLILTGL
ncbi:MAG: carotenoid biosynthesis protein [Bacteroidales bacterium]